VRDQNRALIETNDAAKTGYSLDSHQLVPGKFVVVRAGPDGKGFKQWKSLHYANWKDRKTNRRSIRLKNNGGWFSRSIRNAAQTKSEYWQWKISLEGEKRNRANLALNWGKASGLLHQEEMEERGWFALSAFIWRLEAGYQIRFRTARGELAQKWRKCVGEGSMFLLNSSPTVTNYDLAQAEP